MRLCGRPCQCVGAEPSATARATEDQTATPNNLCLNLNGAAKYQGEIVRDIQFRGITGTNPEMLRGLMLVKTGEPLDREIAARIDPGAVLPRDASPACTWRRRPRKAAASR